MAEEVRKRFPDGGCEVSYGSLLLEALEEIPDVYLLVTELDGTLLYQNVSALSTLGNPGNVSRVLERASERKVRNALPRIERGKSIGMQIDLHAVGGAILACRFHIFSRTEKLVWLGWREPLEDLAEMVEGVIGQMGDDHRALAKERRRDRRNLESLREHLQKERAAAESDPLTGLANRRGLEAYLRRLSETDEVPFAVFTCDLDGFKEINDVLGHAAGDNVLVGFSAQLLSLTRDEDLVARPGGDEFIIVAPFLDRRGIGALIARIKEATRRCDTGGIHLSVSVGVARHPQEADTPKQALHLSDERMYVDKKLGRSRTRRREEN